MLKNEIKRKVCKHRNQFFLLCQGRSKLLKSGGARCLTTIKICKNGGEVWSLPPKRAPLAAPVPKSLYAQRNLSWIQAKFNTYTKVVLFFLFSIYCTTFVANNAGFC